MLKIKTNENQEKKVKTSYELITQWTDVAYTLNLSAIAIHIMIHLLRYYNPNKKYVFPHQETLAKRTNTSLATVKRAINELIKNNLLIRTRKNNGNLYVFTGKLFELLNSSFLYIPTAQNELCMNEQNKEHNKTTNKVVFSDKNVICKNEKLTPEGEEQEKSYGERKTIFLFPIPEILKQRNDIKNLNAYWNSLNVKAKNEWYEKQKEIDKKQEIIAENKRIEQLEKERKKQEIEQIKQEKEKPIKEQYTREQAIKIIKNLNKLPNSFKTNSQGFKYQLLNEFNIKNADLV